MQYEVTIVEADRVLIDADNEEEAGRKALELGVFETQDGADYDVKSVSRRKIPTTTGSSRCGRTTSRWLLLIRMVSSPGNPWG